MQNSNFIKVILTIIAINLTLLSLNSIKLIPEVRADTIYHDQINKASSNYGLVPLNEDGSINVKLVNQEDITVKVKLTEISSSEILSIKINEVDEFAYKYVKAPIPVKVKN